MDKQDQDQVTSAPDLQWAASEAKKRRTTLTLALMVLGMFGFGFALVPLYTLMCEVGILNGGASASGRILEATPSVVTKVDNSRLLTVQFDATINQNLPWEFYPMTKQMTAHPGERVLVNYYVKNNADHAITGQAIPGITPWQMTEHFHKIQCFCFTQQTLQAGESKQMPVWFVIDPKVSDEYKTVTLSYTFMDTDLKAGQHPDQQAGLPNKLTEPKRSVN